MAEPPPVDSSPNEPYPSENNSSSNLSQPSEDLLRALQAVKTEAIIPEVPQPQALPQPELPPSEYELVKQHLKENPQDNEHWRRLIDIAEESEDINRLKEAYDLLLDQFPSNSSAQLSYLQHFSTDSQYSETLFKRFLWSSPSVDLWMFYLTYVRRVNVGAGARNVIQKSFEFALAHIGQDKDSGHIWSDYIDFLKSGETSSTWEEQQKMDALRKVYHRAVQIPLDNVEKLWQELETFETNLNRITAKKFMSDLSPSHMQARTVLRQLQKHLGPLFPPMPHAAPGSRRPALSLYLPSPPTFTPPDRALVGAWKAYLKWEESNPLEIDEREKASLITRIQAVYRKAVIRMRYYSEIWFMAYTWASSVGKDEEALSLLKAGIKANPSSPLLNYAYAEVLEAKGDLKGVHEVYNQLQALLQKGLEAADVAAKANNTPTSSNGDGPNSQSTTNSVPGLSDSGLNSKDSSFSASEDSKPLSVKEFNERRAEYGVVYIMYMRFSRRTEGIKAARAVFQRARKDKWIPWEVYDASALMEYHCSQQSEVSLRIYEKGLELFGNEVEYVHRYLTFLISINDENNARALFERVIGNLPADKARPLWERWARYTYQYGELEAVQKLEKRIAEVYPNDPAMKRFAQKYMYHGIDVIAVRDLGFSVSRSSSSGPHLGRTETQPSVVTGAAQSVPGISAPSISSGHKRPSSPDHRKGRDEGSGRGDYGPASKRQRPISPPPRDRDGGRDRWDGPSRRRHSPLPDRDRGRDRDREDEKPLLPSVIPWFIGQLPSAPKFNGPVFRTDDLLTLFRNAVIPSTSRVRSPPPVPPPRGGGRPPPDYSPYTGPGGPRRRY